MTHKKGFTLIELLVVIAIIGILAGLIIANLSTARAKARDGKRKSDVKAIQTALELMYDDKQSYQVAGSGSSGAGCGWFNYQGGGYPISVAQKLVSDGYLTQIVKDDIYDYDPGNGASAYMIYDMNGGGGNCGSWAGYVLYVRLEKPKLSANGWDQASGTCASLPNATSFNMNSVYKHNYCVNGGTASS